MGRFIELPGAITSEDTEGTKVTFKTAKRERSGTLPNAKLTKTLEGTECAEIEMRREKPGVVSTHDRSGPGQ